MPFTDVIPRSLANRVVAVNFNRESQRVSAA